MLTESITTSPPLSPPRSQGRRSFISTGLLSVAGASAAAFLNPRAQGSPVTLSSGDQAVLSFLAAAELIETDLWQQYHELAEGNSPYKTALKAIDPSMPDYVTGDFNDEASHAALINAFLVANDVAAVNLDAFRTLPGSHATGSSKIKRLTNLTALTVDTTYYLRYRGALNPDYGDTPPMAAIIKNQAAIPVSDAQTANAAQLQGIAQSAAFHFGMIEQGGSSLYTALLPKVSDPNALAILASIGPTEFWHFSLFMSALEGIVPFHASADLAFPDLRFNAFRGRITPHPAHFFASSGLPLTSVLRPSSIAQAGAVATATALVNSGLFTGQSQAFLSAVTTLATNADNAMRSF